MSTTTTTPVPSLDSWQREWRRDAIKTRINDLEERRAELDGRKDLSDSYVMGVRSTLFCEIQFLRMLLDSDQ